MKNTALIITLFGFILFQSVAHSHPNDAQKIKILEKRLTDLENRLNKITKAIRINGNTITLESTGSIAIKSPRINLQASNTIEARGALIRFNGGNKPIAHVGSQTSGTRQATIVNGSTSILVP